MTDPSIVPLPAETAPLPKFGGQQPAYATVKLSGAADLTGNASRAFPLDGTIHVLASFRVRGVSHERDTHDALRRCHALALQDLVVVESDGARSLIRATFEDLGLIAPSLDLH